MDSTTQKQTKMQQKASQELILQHRNRQEAKKYTTTKTSPNGFYNTETDKKCNKKHHKN